MIRLRARPLWLPLTDPVRTARGTQTTAELVEVESSWDTVIPVRKGITGEWADCVQKAYAETLTKMGESEGLRDPAAYYPE